MVLYMGFLMTRSTPLDRHLGAKIAYYRTLRHFTQAELAEKLQLVGCNLTRNMVNKIESGYRATSIFEIDCFVEVLGISYDQLFEK